MKKLYAKKILHLKEENVKKVSVDRENSLVLLAKNEKGEGYIIYYNTTSSIKSHFPLGNEFDLNCVLFVQPIERKSWLLIMRGEEGEGDRAVIVNGKGETVKEFYVGTGIAHCQVDKDDSIWISYFDEGVFSGHPLTQDGIIAFNKDGEIVFQKYGQYVEEELVPPIDDCYAMNVTDDSVWLCYYSDFPLVQMKNGQIHRQWNVEPYIERPDGFAVSEHHILFGSVPYKISNRRIQSYSLVNNDVTDFLAYSEEGKEIPFDDCFGCGSILYLRTEEALYCVDIRKSG